MPLPLSDGERDVLREQEADARPDCPRCGGTGRTRQEYRELRGVCQACGGTGQVGHDADDLAEPLSDSQLDAMAEHCEALARELMATIQRELENLGIVEFILANKGRPEATLGG